MSPKAAYGPAAPLLRNGHLTGPGRVFAGLCGRTKRRDLSLDQTGGNKWMRGSVAGWWIPGWIPGFPGMVIMVVVDKTEVWPQPGETDER